MSAPSIPSKSTICEPCSNLRSSQRAAGSKWPKSPGTASLETPVLAHIHPSPKLRERGLGKSSCLRSVSLEATFHFLARWLLVGLHSPASLYGYRRSYSQHKHPCGSQDTSSWRGNHGKIALALPPCLGLESSNRQDLALGMCISNSLSAHHAVAVPEEQRAVTVTVTPGALEGEVLERGPSPDPFNFLSTYWGSICYS